MGEDLAAVLERHREELSALAGVVGTAIGRSAGGEPAIHVYVMADPDVARLRAEAERVLGDARVEVIATGLPEAQADD